MIKFGNNPWHRRIVDWGMGKKYLAWKDYNKNTWDDKFINLCPYVRTLVAVILISPWIAFWKILPEYCTYDHDEETKAILIIGSICSIIHVIGTLGAGFEWWWVPLGSAIMTGIVFGVIGLIFGCIVLKERWDDRPMKKRKPSIVREYFRAKHDKVCPRIEFEED